MKKLHYTLQTLLRGGGSNIIKVTSLTLGLLVSIILFSRVAFELSYDSFFRDVDNLYLIKTAWVNEGKAGSMGPYTLAPMASAIVEAFPDEVESGVTLTLGSKVAYKIGARKIEAPMIHADSLFFRTMGVEVLQGNPSELANPDVVFLSQSLAREMYGDESPVGQRIKMMRGETIEITVKGVYTDIPDNVSFDKYTSIVSFATAEKYGWWSTDWNSGGNYNAFVRLKQGKKSAEILNAQLTKVIAQHIPEENGLSLEVLVSPLRSVHLEDKGVQKIIWIMSLLGFAILFTVTMNYVLISVSSLTHRAKSIGVHKCSGASGGNIFLLFLYETLFVILLSLLCMGFILFYFREKIEELADVSLISLFTWHNLWAPLSVVAFLFIVGGVLPGRMFSTIPVTQVFLRYTKGNRGWKRPLLFIQFAGVAFILGLMCVVYLQYHYIVSRDMGYRPERVAYVWNQFAEPENARMNLKSLPYVESLASTTRGDMMWMGNRGVTDANGKTILMPRYLHFDKDFLSFIGIRLRAGRNMDGPNQLLVSPTYVEEMGWKGSGVGEVTDVGTVVGVIEPFCCGTLPAGYEPLEMGWEGNLGDVVHVRLKEPFEENLQKLNLAMKEMYPQEKEIVFESLEQNLAKGYHPTRIFRDSTTLASITILFITIMGLIGYTNDEVRRRSKEIAIRKVNGADTSGILRLLSKDVLWTAIPSILIGIGGAYYVSNLWLSQFPDVIEPSIGWYVLVALSLLAFILGCVVWKSWRIASENPVNSIQSE